MAQLKKFMFDNFVIETRPEADEPEPPVDEETAAEPVSPTEQEENVSAESPAETAAEPIHVHTSVNTRNIDIAAYTVICAFTLFLNLTSAQ